MYGGLTLADDLEMISRLCGTRLELVPDPDGPTGQGHARFERVPVCPPDRVRTIPQWHALLIHRATPATMIRMSPYWQRRDVRRSPRVQAGPVPQVPPIDDPAAGLVPDDPATPTPDEPGPQPRPAIAPPGDGDRDNLPDAP